MDTNHDILSREDIALLVDRFYTKVIKDDVIGDIFTKAVHLSWDVHIPVMVSFWSTILLGEVSYKGNPMVKHIELNHIVNLKPAHFERWLMLWETTIQENFSGTKAEEAITRAKTIAQVMQQKISWQ